MLTWMDWLRTPMAAPETRSLKFMRVSILVICLALIVSIAAITPLKAAIGAWAGGTAGLLMLALVIVVPFYVITKNRADDAHLIRLISVREKAERDANILARSQDQTS